MRPLVPPMLSIANQLEAAYQGQDVTLECQTEAYPASINYWTTEKGDMIISGNETNRSPSPFRALRAKTPKASFEIRKRFHVQMFLEQVTNTRRHQQVPATVNSWSWKSARSAPTISARIGAWRKTLSARPMASLSSKVTNINNYPPSDRSPPFKSNAIFAHQFECLFHRINRSDDNQNNWAIECSE